MAGTTLPPVAGPAYAPPPPERPVRRRRSYRGWVISVVLLGLVIGGIAATVLPPSSPGHQFWASLVGGSGDSQVTAIDQVIQRANTEQAQAVSTNNPSVMTDTATAAYYRQLVQIEQQMLAQGVTSIQLTNLTLGPVTVSGTTASATTHETWVTTYSDGTTSESTDTNVYTLVQQNGTWLIEADQQPATANPTTPPGASGAPQPQPTPLPAVTTSMNISHNWSGYAATQGTYTGVTGTWTIPQPSSSSAVSGVGATWVGIGGVNSRDLIQAGTQDVTSVGQHKFQTWIETLPQPSQQVQLAVAPGDSITVSINESAQGSDAWSIAIKNNTTGRSYQTTVQYQSSESSAEWIEEAPANVSSNATTILPLDYFGTVAFSGATAAQNGHTVDMTQAGAQSITMVNSANQALAVPSGIGTDRASFTVTRTSASASSTPIGPGRGQRGGGTRPLGR